MISAEIITVGTEILMGQILNSNARYISARLADMGVNLYHHITVGDNHQRLLSAIKEGFSRADVLIFTGGLGPTEDDITKEVVAEAMGLGELQLHDESKAALEARFKASGYACTPNNYKQAMFPIEGCTVLPNPNGSAPGCIMEKDGKAAILMPGPPWEMEPMFEAQAVPFFERRSGQVFHSRTIRIFGMGESQVAHSIRDITAAQENPTIAPYATAGETTLRVTARCKDHDQGEAMVQPVIDAICGRVGEFVYSTHGRGMEEVCALLLERAGLKLAVAESCTGGLVASRLISVPGSSQWFLEGSVAYSPAAKIRTLGVKEATLNEFTDVSAETACEMAEGIRRLTGADIGLSTTGYAGPGGAAGQVGRVFVGLSSVAGTQAGEFTFRGNRQRVRDLAVLNALNLVRKFILNNACNLEDKVL